MCAVFHRAIIYVCRSHVDGTQLEDRKGKEGGWACHDFSIFPTEKMRNGLHTVPSLFSLSCFCSLLCVSAVSNGSRTAAPGPAPCWPVSQWALLTVSKTKKMHLDLQFSDFHWSFYEHSWLMLCFPPICVQDVSQRFLKEIPNLNKHSQPSISQVKSTKTLRKSNEDTKSLLWTTAK